VKRIWLLLLLISFLLTCWIGYNRYVSQTKIAFVSFQDHQLARIVRANENWMISIKSLPENELEDAGNYDAVYIFGRGFHLNQDQLAQLKKAGSRGTKIYMIGARDPANNPTNLVGKELVTISNYFDFGGAGNYKRLLNYTRREIDKKTLFSDPIEDPETTPSDVYFYLGDENTFHSLQDFEDYRQKSQLVKPGAPKVCLLTSVPGPFNSNREYIDQIITTLAEREINLYPIASTRKRLEFLTEISPDIVLFLPHGRLAIGDIESSLNWLKLQNIPLLCPVIVYQNHQDWLKDQQGMVGGLLTMSVVMPEFDGGIQPYAIAATFKDDLGFEVFKAIPDRVEKFGNLIEKWLALKKKTNAEKKVAIYYYKGPGLNTLRAADLEVGASLYNLLRHLKKSGYTVTGLPGTEAEFIETVQQRGPVLGPYAEGTFDKYLREGDPALVKTDEYEKWCRRALKPEMYAEVEAVYGKAPGDYLSVRRDDEDFLAVTRVQFGNVAILPQPMAGLGEKTFKIVHGTKKAPPHPYIASYLWTRNAFQADAIMHFGTHGSLEFTPWKQIALSGYDWSDALMGAIPHPYIYTISNVGEAIIAKRRSYATILSHLTPPFMESGLSQEFAAFKADLLRCQTSPDDALRYQYGKNIKQQVLKMGLHRDLGLDSTSTEPYNEDELQQIANYVESLGNEKVISGLYTLGESWTKTKQKETAILMVRDIVSNALAKIDFLNGKTTEKQLKHETFFSQQYQKKAGKIIKKVLLGKTEPESFISSKDLERAKKWRQTETDPISRLTKKNHQRKNGLTLESYADSSKYIQELLPKILVDADKKAFLVSLASQKKFDEVSKTLDPEKIVQAKSLARFIPSMAKTLRFAEDPEISTLIGFMQIPQLKAQIMEMLENPSILEKVEEEKLTLHKKITRTCLTPHYLQALKTALSKDAFSLKIAKFDIYELKAFTAKLEYYQNNLPILKKLKSESVDGLSTIDELLQKPGLEQQLYRVLKQSFVRVEELAEHENEFARAVQNFQNALKKAPTYETLLASSPKIELDAVVRSLAGGYIEPGVTGDLIFNPDAVPTGKNTVSIDAEKTPTTQAWEVGKKLTDAILEDHLKRKGSYPKKMAFTLWAGEFIKTEGTTIAQALYALGIEPVRDAFDRMVDLKLIPSAELGRPRIDIVVQTSGQVRDLAASRMTLINKAVALAAAAENDGRDNFVREGAQIAEQFMKERGLSPLEAREFATLRVFGGINGNYGTQIMEMVESGDTWEKDNEVASQYLNNMGAVYDENHWSEFKPGVFEAALQNTELIVQPRSSNTWGPLALDHVYEFFGGMNLAVRNVTGKDAASYFTDYRNAGRPKVQEAKEAIWAEARTTLLNKKFIKEMTKEGPSAGETFAETFRNTYGWNVMKPSAIDDALWNDLHDVYVRDKLNLNLQSFFEDKNPYALQEMTAVMLETARKGLWKASDKQLNELANLHGKLVKDFNAGCSEFVCANKKLREFASKFMQKELNKGYSEKLKEALEAPVAKKDEAVVLSKEEQEKQKQNKQKQDKDKPIFQTSTSYMIAGFLLVISFLILIVLKRSKRG